MPARIVQLTDLHLPPDRTAARWRRLERLLDGLTERAGPIDRLVLTGDLSTHGQTDVYRALRELLSPWLTKVRLVPGNHDDSARIRQIFADRLAPGAPDSTFVDEVDGLRLIGLDSSRRYRVSGKLGRTQLRWLRDVLPRGLPALLFCHHPPIPVGTWWLDKDRLRDAEKLRATLEAASVLGLVCGHVHQEASGALGRVPVFTTPSTAYQFLPGSVLPRPMDLPPGFRVLEFRDGALETRVMRVER